MSILWLINQFDLKGLLDDNDDDDEESSLHLPQSQQRSASHQQAKQ